MVLHSHSHLDGSTGLSYRLKSRDGNLRTSLVSGASDVAQRCGFVVDSSS